MRKKNKTTKNTFLKRWNNLLRTDASTAQQYYTVEVACRDGTSVSLPHSYDFELNRESYNLHNNPKNWSNLTLVTLVR